MKKRALLKTLWIFTLDKVNPVSFSFVNDKWFRPVIERAGLFVEDLGDGNGEPVRRWVTMHWLRHELTITILRRIDTRSFGTPVHDFDAMMGALSQYAMRAGEKLRQHRLVAARLTALFHTNRHRPERPQYGGSRTVALHPMTSDSLELISAARRAAGAAWRDGFAYTKAGVLLDDLIAADLRPRTLFEG